MRFLSTISSIILLIYTFSSCTEDETYFIDVKIDNLEGETAYLRRIVIEDNSLVTIDSAFVGDGHFSFRGKVNKTLAHIIQIENTKNIIPLFVENTDINIVANIDNLHKAKIIGSKINSTFNEFIHKVEKFGQQQQQEIESYNQASANNDLNSMQSSEENYMEQQEQLNLLIDKTIIENNHNILAPYLTYHFSMKFNDKKAIKLIYDNFSPQIKHTSYAKAVKKHLETAAGLLEIGQIAPDIKLKNSEGKFISLSELRGKYVLLDFWASWCKPCRLENPNNVMLFNKYRNKDFEIFGISLDQNLQEWTKAIKNDKLTWNNVIDRKGEVAQLYKITAIPYTILLNKEGKIIHKNIRGEMLKEKLKEIFEDS